MTKTVVALGIVLLAMTVGGCNDDDPAPAAPGPTSNAAAPASAAPAPATAPASAGVRAQSCRDILPLLDELRKLDPNSAQQTAENTIANLPSTPAWSSLSAADQQATIAGIRDAAKGQCL